MASDGAELGDVEELQGAATEGGADEYLGAVVKFNRLFVDGGGGGDALDGGSDIGQCAVEGSGVFGQVVEVVEGEFDFTEFCLGVWQGSVDYTCVVVRGEEAGVEHAYGHVGGDAELTDLEDVVAGVRGVVQFFLGPVHAEADEVAGFVGYPIEVVDSPLGVCEEFS